MVVNVPRIVESVANDPREMVRVQFSERDTRSYTRLEAEKLIAGGTVPGAFIVGDADVKDAAENGSDRLSGEGSTFEEAAEDLKSKAGAKAQRSAPNKARQPKTNGDGASRPASAPPAETKADPAPTSSPDPSTAPVETKGE